MLKQQSHEYRVLLTNGKVVGFTLRELRGFVRSRNVIILMVATVVLLAFANPTFFPTIPNYASRAFYWALCILLYALVVPYWAQLIFAVWGRFTSLPVPLLLGGAPLAFGLSYFAEVVALVLGDWAPDRGVEISWRVAAKNCLIAHVIETLALAWLLPLYRAERAVKAAAAQQDQKCEDEFIVLNRRSIPKRSIKYVQSAEHYLIVTTDYGETEYRARLKDLVTQMGENCGVQTHRSYWVSEQEAVELSGRVVKTSSGMDIPVSKGREAEVRDWFRSQGKPH